MYQNKLTKLLRTATQKYYETQIEKASNDIKQRWKLLNEIIHKRKSKYKPPSRFKYNNSEITDPTQIANTFCSYFTSIGQSLAEQIPVSPVSPKSFLRDNYNESVFLSQTTKDEIIKISKSFQSGKAPGFDGVKMTTVKQSIAFISEPLSHNKFVTFYWHCSGQHENC